ncbi:MAG TPA: PAS domain S-box protein [Vicinamibacteria bacterium]|nr:PAS domain S-box protein [Vicinamibacteria bacterium]
MSLSDPAFRVIFEDAPFGILVVDDELKVVDVNQAYCDMLGRTEAEVMSMSVPDFTHPDDRQRDREFVPLLLSGQLPRYTAEKRYLRKDGEVVWARIVVTALLEPDGRSRYVFSMVRPLTDERAFRSLLKTCSSCRRVQEPNGLWWELEAYLVDRARAEVREGLCPDCARGAR